MDQVRVQVLFTRETEYGSYTDALYYDPVEYESKKEEEIEAEKDARVAAYVDAIKNPPPPEEPTPEQLQANLDDLEQTIAFLSTKKEEIATEKVQLEVALAEATIDVVDVVDIVIK